MRKIQPVPDHYIGQTVHFYRNLEFKNDVVMTIRGYVPEKKGYRTVGHCQEATLKDVVFSMSEAGRERARRNKRRNVHAWAIGTYLPGQSAIATLPLYYNCFTTDQFRVGDANGPVIYRCRWLVFRDNQVYLSSDATSHPPDKWADEETPAQLSLITNNDLGISCNSARIVA